jgi:tetratricopeptide (TPR) repeat protein
VRLLESKPEQTSKSRKSSKTSHVFRACKLLEYGCEKAPDDPRWSFAAGVAFALAGDFTASAEHFSKARKGMADHPYTLLGLALSLQSGSQGAKAREALGDVLRLLETTEASAEMEKVGLAARFAMAMSHARDRQWRDAAERLQPLLTHPLISQSQRITPKDIAQAAVAYYAAAGDKETAGKLVQQYLKDSKGLGATLIGLMQADAGDYEGAAKTLVAAYSADRNPRVLAVLVGCVLAAAAAAVRDGDLPKADKLVAQALRYAPSHAEAKSLQQAIAFARNLNKLDLARLDEAIQQCASLLQSGDRSPQIVRSLATLYHRKAAQAESRGRAADQAWDACIKFWKQFVLGDDQFWGGFTEAYNAGKSRRERLKPDDVVGWRKSLPTEMAEKHVDYAGEYLRHLQSEPLKRHLRLIWEWDPRYDPGDGFLREQIGADPNERVIGTLQGAVDAIKNKTARKPILRTVALFWCAKGSAILNEQIALINRLATTNPVLAMGMLQQIKPRMREGLRMIEKAYRLAPHDETVKKQYNWAKTQCREVDVY